MLLTTIVMNGFKTADTWLKIVIKSVQRLRILGMRGRGRIAVEIVYHTWQVGMFR